MSKQLYVFSTLSAPVAYEGYVAGGGALPKVHKSVTINGEAGIANKFLHTPRGVATAITEEDGAFLEEQAIFRLHKENGFVMIDYEGDADSVALDMTGRDASAPLVPEDYVDAAIAAPTTAGSKNKRN